MYSFGVFIIAEMDESKFIVLINNTNIRFPFPVVGGRSVGDGQNAKDKPRSEIWKYYRPSNNLTKSSCRFCNGVICSNTTNLRRHLKAYHSDRFYSIPQFL